MRWRKRVRLEGYDYRSHGLYFLTICTLQMQSLFAEIKEKKLVLSEVGEVAERCWLEIPQHFAYAELDAHVIMPNHMHGILFLNHGKFIQPEARVFGKPQGGSVSTIAGAYKAAVSRTVNRRLGTPGQTLWQDGFHDHVIRSEAALGRIRSYIENNPGKWLEDKFHPSRIPE